MDHLALSLRLSAYYLGQGDVI